MSVIVRIRGIAVHIYALCLMRFFISLLLTRQFVSMFCSDFCDRLRCLGGCCKYEYELIPPSLLLSGTRLYIMSGDHGNCMQANLTSTHLPCYWLQIMMIESYHCTRWSYWRWVSFAIESTSLLFICAFVCFSCVLFSFIDFVLLFVSVVCVIFSSIV